MDERSSHHREPREYCGPPDVAAIERFELLLAGIPMEQEATTTEAGTLGFHHGQHRLGGDQGIHR